MNETTWIRITACDNIPPREGRHVAVNGRDIAIFNLGDRFLATDNRCPHKGGPLSDGIVSGTSVVCPLHAWKVCIETGAVQRPTETGACVETYPVRVEDGIIAIQLSGVHRSNDSSGAAPLSPDDVAGGSPAAKGAAA